MTINVPLAKLTLHTCKSHGGKKHPMANAATGNMCAGRAPFPVAHGHAAISPTSPRMRAVQLLRVALRRVPSTESSLTCALLPRTARQPVQACLANVGAGWKAGASALHNGCRAGMADPGRGPEERQEAAPEAGKEAPKPTAVDKAVALVPGIALSAAVMQSSFLLADGLGKALMSAQGVEATVSPVSGIPVAILAGMALNNTVALPASVKAGTKFCTTTVLRAGIVCVGAKLSAVDMVTLGAMGVPAVMACIGTGLGVATVLGRTLQLPGKMSSLIAAGTSICGVTAITALAPAIQASEREVAVAVANVVAFGTIGMLTYPYLAHAMLENSQQVGMFLGLAIHVSPPRLAWGCPLDRPAPRHGTGYVAL